jgi:hypothetical protein
LPTRIAGSVIIRSSVRSFAMLCHLLVEEL